MLPITPDEVEPAWHLFVIRHPRRDEIQKLLINAGIGTLIHYPIPPHLQLAFKNMGFYKNQFPIAEKIANEIISLPIGPHINSFQVEAIMKKIIEIDFN